jgi:predicted nucleic acid-binding protein
MRVIDWVALDEVTARRAGALGQQWRASHAIGTADLIIAATAEELGSELATSNVRHFPMFPTLAPPYG